MIMVNSKSAYYALLRVRTRRRKNKNTQSFGKMKSREEIYETKCQKNRYSCNNLLVLYDFSVRGMFLVHQ